MALNTKEAGRSGEVTPHYGMRTGDFVAELLEDNPDLRFPNNVRVYDRMIRTDGQVGGILRAWKHAVMSAQWDMGCPDDDMLTAARIEFGLPAPGDRDEAGGMRRRHNGIKWKQHLAEVTGCLGYGFAPFEKVWDDENHDPLPGQSYPGKQYWTHVRKLAYRPPRTVKDILVGEDGGLRAMTQDPRRPVLDAQGNPQDVRIDVENLVWYVLDRQGPDWTGTSILRTAYKDWLVKEDVTRMNVTSIHRGLGIPMVQTDDDSDEGHRKAMRTAQQMASGPDSGVVYMRGTEKPYMQGLTGTIRDPLPTIAHHNQEMSKGALTLWMDLGHDAGARSLGETFYRLWLDALQEVLDMVAETFTEYVLRPWAEYNFGPDASYPVLSFGDLTEQDLLTPEGMKALADSRIITPDDGLEQFTRDRFGMPARVGPREAPAAVSGAVDPQADAEDVADELATRRGTQPALAPGAPPIRRVTASRHLTAARELLRQVEKAEAGE